MVLLVVVGVLLLLVAVGVIRIRVLEDVCFNDDTLGVGTYAGVLVVLVVVVVDV